MKTIKYLSYIVLGSFVLLTASCEPSAPEEQSLFLTETEVSEFTADGTIYSLNDLLDTFMTEEGNYANDSMASYRTRGHNSNFPDIYLFAIDTLPKGGPGIYIRGRISTDDFAGNFYKSMVIQQIGDDGKQQNLRISVDLGSSGGMYQLGQEIIIRCNGLAVGRYANQPQLCVPTYNNNVYADTYGEKVGWAPGRIPSAVFRRQTRMIGTPNPKLLQYAEMTISELYTLVEQAPTLDASGMDKVRKADGMLVRLTNVHFTGQYLQQNGTPDTCNTQHPDSSEYANVFAPTTKNLGYPQSRIVADPSGAMITCSASEYAKYACYYLPGADKYGVSNCSSYVGTVTGILGWYFDNAKYLPKNSSDSNYKSYQYKWSITPRGIKKIGVEDIILFNANNGEEWIPQEFDPQDYKNK